MGISYGAGGLTMPKLLEMLMQAVITMMGIFGGLRCHPVDGGPREPGDLVNLPLGYARTHSEPDVVRLVAQSGRYEAKCLDGLMLEAAPGRLPDRCSG